MVHSLQFRLIISFTLVILVTVGAVFFFINRATEDEIRQFEERAAQVLADRMGFELSRYYSRQGGWQGIQPFVEQWGSLYGQQLIVTDASGTVVADSQGRLLGSRYQPNSPGNPLLSVQQGSVVGTLYVSPESSPSLGSIIIVYNAVGRFFLWGACLQSRSPSSSPFSCRVESWPRLRPLPPPRGAWGRAIFHRG